MFNMFSGGALSRFSLFALNVVPYISASIIVQLLAQIVPSLKAIQKEGESGRRKHHPVVAHRHDSAGGFPGVRHRHGAAEPGAASGIRWCMRRASVSCLTAVVGADRGHDVPDVARRADHRARHRQRHFADHLRRHRCRLAGRVVTHAGQLQQRRHGAPLRWCVALVLGVHLLRRVRRTRAAPHHGQLRAPPGRPQRVPEPDVAPAAEAQHVGRDPGDLRVDASSCSRRPSQRWFSQVPLAVRWLLQRSASRCRRASRCT